MTPSIRKTLLENSGFSGKNPKRAGVLALVYPNPLGEATLLLILRKTYEGVHSNQIGFPGGKEEDQDDTLLQTALRETHEEVGVVTDKVEVLRELTDVYIPPSNFLVTPFLGLYSNPQPFKLQESEVEQVVEVRIQDFLNDQNLIEQKLSTSYANNIDVPAFKLNGYVVWGATAMMLSEIKVLLRQVL